jgi:hypothetical protein
MGEVIAEIVRIDALWETAALEFPIHTRYLPGFTVELIQTTVTLLYSITLLVFGYAFIHTVEFAGLTPYILTSNLIFSLVAVYFSITFPELGDAEIGSLTEELRRVTLHSTEEFIRSIITLWCPITDVA